MLHFPGTRFILCRLGSLRHFLRFLTFSHIMIRSRSSLTKGWLHAFKPPYSQKNKKWRKEEKLFQLRLKNHYVLNELTALAEVSFSSANKRNHWHDKSDNKSPIKVAACTSGCCAGTLQRVPSCCWLCILPEILNFFTSVESRDKTCMKLWQSSFHSFLTACMTPLDVT